MEHFLNTPVGNLVIGLAATGFIGWLSFMARSVAMMSKGLQEVQIRMARMESRLDMLDRQERQISDLYEKIGTLEVAVSRMQGNYGRNSG